MTTRFWLIIAPVLVLALGCSRKQERAPASEPPDAPDDIVEQVHAFCGACHAYPPADTFPRRHWKLEVERGYRFFDESALPLKPPPFASVVRYYESRAPEELPDLTYPKPSRDLDLSFDPISYPGPEVNGSYAISNVNVVHLTDPKRPEILACDMRHGLVMLLKPSDPEPKWKVIARVPHPAKTEVVDLDGDGINDILVADLGSFTPTDKRDGTVVWLRGKADGTFEPITLLRNVGRVSDVRAADFRATGKKDLVVAVFGLQHTGELLFLENHTTDWSKPSFTSRVLDARHGTIHVPIVDLNGDGKPDIVALISQEHEVIVGYLNEGNGKFRKQTLYSAPHPGYGSSGIEMVDLDGDGKLDILYTNGDVLDEPYLFKPYHGVQWLKNKGNLTFEHQALTPMYGAHRAVAADFRGDGKKGIVAASFLPVEGFPERVKRKADALILLDPKKAGGYDRHSLARVDADHVSCAAGDLYGTGRADIVVGNFGSAKAKHPVVIWRNRGVKGGR